MQRSDHSGKVARQAKAHWADVRRGFGNRGDIAIEPAHNGPPLGIAQTRLAYGDNLRHRYWKQWPYERQPTRFLLDARGSTRLSRKSDEESIAESKERIA